MPNRLHPVPVEQDLKEQMLQDLVAYYYGMGVRTNTLSAFGNVVLVAALYTRYREWPIAVWGAIAIAMPIARIALSVLYSRDPHARAHTGMWERYMFRATTFTAFVYACGLPLLFQDGEHVHNGLVVIWCLMLISGMGSSAFAMKRMMLVFCSILGAALTLRLATIPHPAYWFTAAGVAVYTAAQMGYGLQSYRLHTASMKQSFINAALARQLEDQVRIAVRASQEKSRFLAAASHDLRQPLHALALSADALLRKVIHTSQEQDVQAMLRSISALSDSLSAMLDLSRLDAGAVPAQKEVVELSDIFAIVHQTFLERANAKGLALRFVHRHATVVADRNLLTRLLSNLVDNAIKYTDQGGVLIATRRKHRDDYDLVVEVRDSGIGIPEEYQENVFEEFFQIGNPGRVRSQGLGLGLSIIRRLAALMDMQLDIHSAPGCGTRFELRCRAGAAAAASSQPAGAPTGALAEAELVRPLHILEGARILVVDNEAAILNAVAELFRLYGAVVDTAIGTDEADRLAKSGEYDLALLDYRLGGNATGIELAEMITRAQSRQLPIVLITGDTNSEEIRAIQARGVEVFFKPLRGDALLALACNVLSRTARAQARLATGALG